MKLVSFRAGSVGRIGIWQADSIREIQGFGADMVSLIRTAPAANTLKLGRSWAMDAVQILAPFLPSTILCTGSNYRAHNKEKLSAPTSGIEPEYFIKTADCVTHHLASIPLDENITQKLDCEVELAIVIGKAGKNIAVEDALDHVFGYSIVNDISARDRQIRFHTSGMTWYDLGRGKVFDASAPFGPCIVTKDEIADPQNLRIRSWVNGELRQSSSTADMIWSCAEIIHFFSTHLTLKPGMLIITGTPAGTAVSADVSLRGNWSADGSDEPIVKARAYCRPGDKVICAVEGIGQLINFIA